MWCRKKNLRHFSRCIIIIVCSAAKRLVEERIRKVGDDERTRHVARTDERFAGRDAGERPTVAESRGAEQSVETQVSRGKGQNERGVSFFFVLRSAGQLGFFFLQEQIFFCFLLFIAQNHFFLFAVRAA